MKVSVRLASLHQCGKMQIYVRNGVRVFLESYQLLVRNHDTLRVRVLGVVLFKCFGFFYTILQV